MKRNSGFTLIEVIISMLLLSIVFITYIHGFQDGVILLKAGHEYTNLTFNAQEEMENDIVETKRRFIDGAIPSSDIENISIFSGVYQSDVEVTEIVGNIDGAREFVTYVSEIPNPKPLPPKVDYDFKVTNFNNTSDYFPWHDNVNRYFRYEYELITNQPDAPEIFENRIRHYESEKDIKNPFFPGDYKIIKEETITNPNVNIKKNERMNLKNSPFLTDRYYYFEVSPYSLSGKVTSVKNSYRVAKYEREGTDFWQELIEEVYFIKYLGKPQSSYESQFFNLESGVETYGEVFQDPEYPRLDIDWDKKNDPEGAIVGKEIPSTYDHKNFISEIRFKADMTSIINGIEQGFGVMIGAEGDSNTNNGTMFTFDISNNKLMVHELLNGKYEGLIQEFDLINNTNFSNFVINNGTTDEFDWDTIYTLVLEYRDDQTILFHLRNQLGASSSPILVSAYDYGYVEHDFIGLKSYSELGYKLQLESSEDIGNDYSRNYGAHFYNISFRNK